jgi:hypothetical protein
LAEDWQQEEIGYGHDYCLDSIDLEEFL